MSTPTDVNILIDRRLEEALRNPGQLSPDEAIEMASQITERGRILAQEHEQSKGLYEAAAFYGKIAATWQQVAVRQIGDWQRYCQSLSDYWAERAAAARRRADEEAEDLAPTRLPVAGQALPMARATPQKPITRPLGPAGIRSEDDTRAPKGVAPSRGASQSKDKKPFFAAELRFRGCIVHSQETCHDRDNFIGVNTGT